MNSLTVFDRFGEKIFTECDLIAAAGVGFLIGSLYTVTILLLIHKLAGAF
jgi:hypothetical protein